MTPAIRQPRHVIRLPLTPPRRLRMIALIPQALIRRLTLLVQAPPCVRRVLFRSGSLIGKHRPGIPVIRLSPPFRGRHPLFRHHFRW